MEFFCLKTTSMELIFNLNDLTLNLNRKNLAPNPSRRTKSTSSLSIYMCVCEEYKPQMSSNGTPSYGESKLKSPYHFLRSDRTLWSSCSKTYPYKKSRGLEFVYLLSNGWKFKKNYNRANETIIRLMIERTPIHVIQIVKT